MLVTPLEPLLDFARLQPAHRAVVRHGRGAAAHRAAHRAGTGSATALTRGGARAQPGGGRV